MGARFALFSPYFHGSSILPLPLPRRNLTMSVAGKDHKAAVRTHKDEKSLHVISREYHDTSK